jgi:hypothetical protein
MVQERRAGRLHLGSISFPAIAVFCRVPEAKIEEGGLLQTMLLVV